MDSAIKKIIVVLPARLGDALFCTPALTLLKRHSASDAVIDVIAMSTVSASMLEFNPAVNQVFINPDEQTLQTLSQQYDLALNLHYEAISDKALASLAPRALSIESHDFAKHQSIQAIEFVQRILKCRITPDEYRYRLYPQALHYQRVQQLLKEQGVNPQKDILIGCHIGCHRIAGLSWWKLLRGAQHKKVWPLENFIKLETMLRAKQPNIRFVLTGSKSEQHLGKKFIKQIPNTINLIDKTSVLELAALMDSLTFYLTSDTGALHVACATNVNILALFGPTSLIRTGPHPKAINHHVIQCSNIVDITVDEVMKIVLNQLA